MARRRKGPAPGRRRSPSVPRFATGRAEDAVDWVAGAGWQDPEDGHLVIEGILALHHDQARSLYRAHQAVTRLTAAGAVRFPDGARVIAMPVDRKLGDIVHAKLTHWLADSDPWRRLVGRIGLGTEPGVDIARLPLQFTRAASTSRDGRLLYSLGSDAFATLDDGRIVGALDAGEAQFDVSRIEDEPCYVSGVGFANEVPDVPSIVFVFAVGRTTAQALTRGCAVFESFDVPAKPHFVLKVARVAPIDGQLLRSGLERARDIATGKSRRALEVGLGEQDHLVAAGEWRDVPDEARGALDADTPAQVTTDGNGHPQVWDGHVAPDPYWADQVQ